MRLIVAGLIAITWPQDAAAQAARAGQQASGWAHNYDPNINYEGITRADRAKAMAHMAEIERIFYRIPELARPQEFVVQKQFFGGARPLWLSNGTAAYTFFLWFFGRYGPNRQQVSGEGCRCIEVTINAEPASRQTDENGMPIFFEADPGEPIPGATAVYSGRPSDEREVSVTVLYTRGDAFPWEPVSREEYLRALIYEAEGKNGEKTAEFRKALEKTAYEQWMDGAAQRKQDRDALAVRLRGIKTAEEIAKHVAAMEASEREVTEGLKAQDAENRKRNQEALARPTYGGQIRARIEAMSPEERQRPAIVERNGELLPLNAPGGTRVLRPKPEFWRVRRSPVEINSITVSIGGSTGDALARPAVIEALQQAYRNLDWGALKRMVDAAR